MSGRGGLDRSAGPAPCLALAECCAEVGSIAASGQGAPVRSSPSAGGKLSDAVSSSETHTEYARNHDFKHDQTQAFLCHAASFHNAAPSASFQTGAKGN